MIDGKKCIGVLTSGGDAPGMNVAIRSVVRTALHNDIIPMGVVRGYNGLLEKNFRIMEFTSVSNILKKGGTILFTARCKEFYEAKYREQAYKNAVEAGMDGLIVIGGDGSYNGARYLSELGLPCIGIPGTIDNDIACTESTIGYDTAMNTVVDLVDRLNDTSQSHHRCTVVEVMGRHAGHMALNTGIGLRRSCHCDGGDPHGHQRDLCTDLPCHGVRQAPFHHCGIRGRGRDGKDGQRYPESHGH